MGHYPPNHRAKMGGSLLTNSNGIADTVHLTPKTGTEAANNRSFFMLADYIFGKKNERNRGLRRDRFR